MLRSLANIRTAVVTALSALVVVIVPAAAAAQTEGRIGVGGSVTFLSPTDSGLANTFGAGPLVRLNPKRGFGLAAGLNWFAANIDNPAGGDGKFARLRVRPLMAGIAYTVGPDKALVSVSLVAGPSWNSIDFHDEYLRTVSGTPEIDVENSLIVRPGVSLTYNVAPRVGIIGFAGYMVNRPDVRYRDLTGRQFENEWRADSIVLSVGAVYSLF
jgi:hypothetical protein